MFSRGCSSSKGAAALAFALSVLSLDADASADGDDAQEKISSRNHKLCASLLAGQAGVDERTAITRIADVYLELLTGPGAGLVSPLEFRAMLESGRLFDLPEGSSVRDHLRDGLRELESVARRVGDPDAVAAEVSRRLFPYLAGLEAAAERSRSAASKRSEAYRERNLPKVPMTSIPIPPIPGASGPTENRPLAISPRGHCILFEQVVRGFPSATTRYLIARESPGGYRFVELKTPPGFPDRPDLVNLNGRNPFSEDGSLFAVLERDLEKGGPDRLFLFDTATGSLVDTRELADGVGAFALAPDGSRALVQLVEKRKSFSLLGLRKPKLAWISFQPGKPGVTALPLPRAANAVVARISGEVWEAVLGLNPYLARIQIAFSRDGAKAAYSGRVAERTFWSRAETGRDDRLTMVWDLAAGKLLDSRADTPDRAAIDVLKFLPGQERLLFSGNREEFAIRDISRGENTVSLESLGPGSRLYPGSLTVSPDGAWIAIESEEDRESPRSLHLWDTRTGKLVTDVEFPRLFFTHREWSTRRFSDDGKFLIHASLRGPQAQALAVDGDGITNYNKDDRNFPMGKFVQFSRDGRIFLILKHNEAQEFDVLDLDKVLAH